MAGAGDVEACLFAEVVGRNPGGFLFAAGGGVRVAASIREKWGMRVAKGFESSAFDAVS
jgi:hypothetical protein